MRAVVLEEFGGPEVLSASDRPDPEVPDGWILVRVRAANVNPTDLAARAGFMVGGPIDPPLLLGWDFAGEVQAGATGALGLATGDRVVGMIPWYVIRGETGAYAELTAVDPSWTVPLPESLDDATAATIPLNALTAGQALDILALDPGDRLLITGASGAVGSFAAQMAVAKGCLVTAVAGRDDEEWVAGLGVATVLGRATDLAGLEPFPYVLDCVPVGEPALRAVADDGTLVSTRPIPESDPSRNLRQEVVMIRTDRERLATLVNDVATGHLKTRVAQVLPLDQAAEAHRLVEGGGLHGKVVLVP